MMNRCRLRNVLWQYVFFCFGVLGSLNASQFVVNQNQVGYQLDQRVASNQGGEIAIIWRDAGTNLWTGADSLYLSTYDEDRNLIVDSNMISPGDISTSPALGMSASGNMVVAYERGGEIYAQIRNINGVAVKSEFQANTYTANRQKIANVAVLTNGTFFVSWVSEWYNDGSGLKSDVRVGQKFNSVGDKVGSEFVISIGGYDVDMKGTHSGGFVYAADLIDGHDVRVGVYDASGSLVGSAIDVFSAAENDCSGIPNIEIGVRSDDSFVIVWSHGDCSRDDENVFARAYDASGNPQTDVFRVNATTNSYQEEPSVCVNDRDGYVIVWEGHDRSIYSKEYDSLHNVVKADTKVNSYTPTYPPDRFFYSDAKCASLPGGAYVVTWEHTEDYADNYDVIARFVDGSWDKDYTDLGGGWRRLDWFGDYVPTGNGWYWHNEHGYFCPSASSTSSSTYFYTMDMGWLFTHSTLYPYLYRFNDSCWLWYLPESSNPRWFNNLTQGQWESRN
jgi:hypothetical protein